MEVLVVYFGDPYERDTIGVAADVTDARNMARVYLATFPEYAQRDYDAGRCWFTYQLREMGVPVDSDDAPRLNLD